MSGHLDAALERLAATPVLLVAVDFDGTLAPIVPDPDDAAPLPRARRALAALARQAHTRVAVVSGRALVDLSQRIGAVEPGTLLVGGHGSEFEPASQGRLELPHARLLEQVRAAVEASAAGLEGVTFEHKDASSALHYRRANRACAAKALTRLRGLRPDMLGVDGEGRALRPQLRRGKKVVELCVLPTHKGDALARLRRELGATRLLYMGDDRTDEDAFRALGTEDVGVKVGLGATAARFRVDDPDAAAEVLVRLVEARRRALLAAVSTPIHALGFLSDRRTGALVDPRGDVVWLCPERFDRPSIFAALLGGPTAGRFGVRPAEHADRGYQRYREDALVLETRWPEMSVVDYLDPGHEEGTVLVRRIEPRAAGARCRIVFAPRPDFARQQARLEIDADGETVHVRAGRSPMSLHAPGCAFRIEREGESETAVAELELELGGGAVQLVLRCGRCEGEPVTAVELVAHGWRRGLEALDLPGAWQQSVRWGAVVLRGLVYEPSGALVAAATTSLPEALGAERNWDYRYCWPRDAAYACDALARLGSMEEGLAFLRWMSEVLEEGSALDLRPLYGVAGETWLVEGELGHLLGYAGSQPVRVGNAAAEQLQIDVYGAIVDLAWTLASCGASLDGALWRTVSALVAAVAERWQEPDAGIWEHRHRIRHHTHSKVMAWVSLDRALRLAAHLGRQAPEAWLPLRDRIAAEVLERGWSEAAGAYAVCYGSDDLDASVLSIVRSGLLPHDDPRAAATVDAIAEALRDGPTVYRYRYDDGFSGVEGGFHICACWLIEAFVATGRRAEAVALFDELLGTAGPTGILSEMVDPATGAALGNTPQAYSHTGVIWAALALAGSPRAVIATNGGTRVMGGQPDDR
jgi:trehalose-phosphatase